MVWTRRFLATNHVHARQNNPLTYLLIRRRRFGGVREQANKHTDIQTRSLKSYGFRGLIYEVHN